MREVALACAAAAGCPAGSQALTVLVYDERERGRFPVVRLFQAWDSTTGSIGDAYALRRQHEGAYIPLFLWATYCYTPLWCTATLGLSGWLQIAILMVARHMCLSLLQTLAMRVCAAENLARCEVEEEVAREEREYLQWRDLRIPSKMFIIILFLLQPYHFNK